MIAVDDIKSQLFPLLLNFTVRNTDTESTPLTYDFSKIEEAIAEKLCTSKPFIKPEVSNAISSSILNLAFSTAPLIEE